MTGGQEILGKKGSMSCGWPDNLYGNSHQSKGKVTLLEESICNTDGVPK